MVKANRNVFNDNFSFKYRSASKRGVITVLLPGAVEAENEILEEGVCSVEDREPDDVHALISYIIQSQQREFLREDSTDEFNCLIVSKELTF